MLITPLIKTVRTPKTRKGPTGPCITVDLCNLAGLIAGLTGGLVAVIVVCALIGAAMVAGGTYAATTALGASSLAGVRQNPLYEGKEEDGDNPLYGCP